jgi:hypothetical protein
MNVRDMVRPHLGWHGQFTTAQYPGALPNGTRVVKVAWEPGDTHSLRDRATVLGSMGHPEVGIGYFVEFDAHPKQAVFIIGTKIAELKQ